MRGRSVIRAALGWDQRTRRQAVRAGLVLLGLLPLLGALALAYAFAVDRAKRDLDLAATAAYRSADRLLEKSMAELGQLRDLAGAECGDTVVRRLRDQVFRSTTIREIGIYSPDLTVRCTNFGPASLRYDWHVVRDFPESGVFLNVMTATALRDKSLVLFYRLPGGRGLNAVIHPTEFIERLDSAASEGMYLALALADGTPIASHMPDQAQALDLWSHAGRSGSRFSLIASAAADRSLIWDRLGTVAPAFAVAGLSLSIPLLWLFGRIARRRASLEAELQAAIRRGDLEIHYQPTIDIQTNRCTGAEALVRWRHPERGLVPPGAFIGIAEETGLVIPMTRWVLRRVAADMASGWRGIGAMRIGVNLSARHFRDATIVEDVRAVLVTHGLPPSALLLEATEREIVDDGFAVGEVMEQLRDLGCAIAVDDFGTGHNGLAFLQKFDLDYVKIDKLFVETIGTDAVSRPVLDTIIDLGQRLGVTLVAEGVEAPQQLAYLRRRGVRYAQGYLFGRPMPFAEFAAYAARYNRAATGTALGEAVMPPLAAVAPA